MTREPHGDGAGHDGAEDELGEERWTPAERALLDAALEFYGAARGVIDFEGGDRPQLRQDAAGFDAVRKAMARLESCVLAAAADGATPERIVQIARIEQEMVELILRRRGPRPPAAPSPRED